MKSFIKNIFLLNLFFLLIVFTSCGQGGTESGNPSNLNIQVLGYQSSELQNINNLAVSIGSINVDTAKIVLDELRFKPFSACTGGSGGAKEINIIGPFVANLIQTETLTGLEGLDIPDARYCRIEIILKKLNVEDVPDDLDPNDPIINRSIFIEGTNAEGIPFQMTTAFDEEFKLENESIGIFLGASFGVTDLIIGFNLDDWFLDVDLSSPDIEISDDGKGGSIIYINDDINKDIQEIIEDNIKRSSNLFEDKDEDNELDLDEEEFPLADGDLL